MKRIWLAGALLASVTLGACSHDTPATETPQEAAADMAPGTTVKGADGSKIKKQADGDVKIKDADGNVVKQDADDGSVKVKDR
jgi:hypothetical protein